MIAQALENSKENEKGKRKSLTMKKTSGKKKERLYKINKKLILQ